jgi:magnesium-transporting ATPase (P-type)
VAVNVVVFVELFYLYNSRSATRSPFQLGFFSNRWVILGTVGIVVLQLLQTYAPFMNEVFKTAPISLEAWGRILLFSVFSFGVIEVEKWLRRRANPGA